MPKYSLMVARFPYGGTEEQETTDYLMKIAVELDRDKRFDVVNMRVADTPITMTRNRVFQRAIDLGMDYLLIIDSDMAPDIELGTDPNAKPFLQTAIDFALSHQGPCIIAAPYCGPPPMENVYVFQWRKWSDLDTEDYSIEQYTREQASLMSGIQKASALPTGLMLIDVRALKAMKKPWTYYEYANDGAKCGKCGQAERGPEDDKISTEDVTFTRDASLQGIGVYCAWDCWAGHVKRHVGRKPRYFTSDVVAKRMQAGILRGTQDGDRMVDIAPPAWLKDRLAAAEAAEKAKVESPTDAVMVAVPPPAPSVRSVIEPNSGVLRQLMEDEAARVRSQLPFPMNGFAGSTVAATVRAPAPGAQFSAQSGIVGHMGYVELPPAGELPPNVGSLTADELFRYDPFNLDALHLRVEHAP